MFDEKIGEAAVTSHLRYGQRDILRRGRHVALVVSVAAVRELLAFLRVLSITEVVSIYQHDLVEHRLRRLAPQGGASLWNPLSRTAAPPSTLEHSGLFCSLRASSFLSAESLQPTILADAPPFSMQASNLRPLRSWYTVISDAITIANSYVFLSNNRFAVL